MANTYTQIHIHAIFSVQNRQSLITSEWRERLYQYMITIIEHNGHKVLAIGGTADHIHLLFGHRPTESLSSLMRELKKDTSLWINQSQFVQGRFSWQEGYGAFSYSKSQLPAVIRYIENQETHHRKTSFREEYKKILTELGIAYDERYIFTDLE